MVDNPLKPLFADIADAIREKDGSAEPIPAETFPERIRDIDTMPDDMFTITVDSSDHDGGSVSGGGIAQGGMTVTATAQAKGGYAFTGWREDGQMVSEEENYTFEVTKDRMLTGVFVGSRLPSGTVELEYIYQTSISQNTASFIELPAISDATYMELKYAHLSGGSVTNDTTMLCGTMTYSSNKVSSLAGISIPRVTSANRYLYIYNNSKTAAFTTAAQTFYPAMHTLILDYTNKKVTLDGAATSVSVGTWFRTALKFFSAKLSGSGTGGVAGYTAVYSVVWKDDSGKILRELVPCRKADGTVCMYDVVGKTYYTDQCLSTGRPGFTAGPAIET